MKRLYLYDFDGTITNKDSLFEFLKFATPALQYNFILLKFLPVFMGTKLGIFNRAKIKQRFISACLKGKSKEEIAALSTSFLEHIQQGNFFKKNSLTSIKINAKKGDVYIVSASLDLWLKPIAEYLGVKLICTEASFDKGIFNGDFKTPNCNYNEKPRRVLNEINLKNYLEIHYFGDSKGDMAMKLLATSFYYRYF